MRRTPAVTRHLAPSSRARRAPLAELPIFAAQPGASFLHPTAVLFNGGVLKSGLLAARVLETLNAWLAADGAAPARVLGGADLDLAVARGAAYHGYVRTRRAACASAAAPRSAYYVGVEVLDARHARAWSRRSQRCASRPSAWKKAARPPCPQEFGLVVGEPVRFRFFGSSVRRQDEVGTLLDFWGPTSCKSSRRSRPPCPPKAAAPARSCACSCTPASPKTGTLELEALPVDGSERWKVQFDVRGTAEACCPSRGDALHRRHRPRHQQHRGRLRRRGG
jgi:hypothetical protein